MRKLENLERRLCLDEGCPLSRARLISSEKWGQTSLEPRTKRNEALVDLMNRITTHDTMNIHRIYIRGRANVSGEMIMQKLPVRHDVFPSGGHQEDRRRPQG